VGLYTHFPIRPHGVVLSSAQGCHFSLLSGYFKSVNFTECVVLTAIVTNCWLLLGYSAVQSVYEPALQRIISPHLQGRKLRQQEIGVVRQIPTRTTRRYITEEANILSTCSEKINVSY
jgi:hypothetical protein